MTAVVCVTTPIGSRREQSGPLKATKKTSILRHAVIIITITITTPAVVTKQRIAFQTAAKSTIR